MGMEETSDGTAALSYETAELLQAWGISVLNPNKTKAQGDCEGAQTHLLLSFPYGQLSFGFKQVLPPQPSPSTRPFPTRPSLCSRPHGHGRHSPQPP